MYFNLYFRSDPHFPGIAYDPKMLKGWILHRNGPFKELPELWERRGQQDAVEFLEKTLHTIHESLWFSQPACNPGSHSPLTNICRGFHQVSVIASTLLCPILCTPSQPKDQNSCHFHFLQRLVHETSCMIAKALIQGVCACVFCLNFSIEIQ